MIEGLFQPIHLIIILTIVLIVFGPGKLPSIGGALGKSIKEFKDSTRDAADAPAAGTSSQVNPSRLAATSRFGDISATRPEEL